MAPGGRPGCMEEEDKGTDEEEEEVGGCEVEDAGSASVAMADPDVGGTGPPEEETGVPSVGQGTRKAVLQYRRRRVSRGD